MSAGPSIRGITGLAATWISHSSDSATPITTPPRTPTESTPTIAATAIQKSTLATRRRRRSSVTSIMPKTTASMITAPSNGLRQVGEQRRQEQQRQDDERPGRRARPAALGARGFVERAGGQACRDRHPLEHARAGVRHALGDRLLVDIDAVAVTGGERARVPRGLEKPISSRADAAMPIVAAWSLKRVAASGSIGEGRPLGTSPTSATPCAPRCEQRRREQPAGHEHERSGVQASAREPQPEDRAQSKGHSDGGASFSRMSPSVPSHAPSSCHALSPSKAVPVSLGAHRS